MAWPPTNSAECHPWSSPPLPWPSPSMPCAPLRPLPDACCTTPPFASGRQGSIETAQGSIETAQLAELVSLETAQLAELVSLETAQLAELVAPCVPSVPSHLLCWRYSFGTWNSHLLTSFSDCHSGWNTVKPLNLSSNPKSKTFSACQHRKSTSHVVFWAITAITWSRMPWRLTENLLVSRFIPIQPSVSFHFVLFSCSLLVVWA